MMDRLKQQELVHFYESIWDMHYEKETDVLTVFCTSSESPPKRVQYKGPEAQAFYNKYVLYLSKKSNPSDRITPLERVDENGIYCYKTERANIRKTMTVEELARDDKYHEFGHEFLGYISNLQHSCAKIEADIKKNAKEAVAKLDTLLKTTDMANKISESDLTALKLVIEDSIEVSKRTSRINAATLTILTRWLP